MHDAPPPHLPQSHYSRTPDLGFGLTVDQQTSTGSARYCCRLDTLENPITSASRGSNQDVLLIGSEGALDICKITRKGKDTIGYIEGLRGSVIDAKILPWTGLVDSFHESRSLVACIVHGPVVGNAADAEVIDASHDTVKDDTPRMTRKMDGVENVTAFQSTVEIFSPSTERHIATLYRGPVSHSKHPISHPLFSPPAPAGDLSISAEGRYMTVVSGQSGEIYVFTITAEPEADAMPTFHCIGKFWTTIRTRQFVPPTTANAKAEQTNKVEPEKRVPIFALSKRWLAIAPPMLSSSQVSVDGTVPLPDDRPSPPGVSAYVSPAPPAPDCEVDVPYSNSIITRVTKQATQELRKGAQWVGEQGMNAFRTYWGRTPYADGIPRQQGGHALPAEDYKPAFPPTHAQGHDQPHVAVEPALLSIIDLQKLEDNNVKSPLMPIATFTLGDGCSFLSFSPTGLALLSSNQLGDASNVWDLMRITDANTAVSLPLSSGGALPHAVGLVRRLAYFARISPSTVVDVQWTAQGNRVGILTDKGTIHLHELPRHDLNTSRVQSPLSLPQSRSGLPSPGTSPQDLPASGWLNNVRSGLQTMHGRLAAVRTRSESDGIAQSTLQTIGSASVAARYAGGRVVRNGYNIAVEGAHNLRHAEDNKIRLQSSHNHVRRFCFRWLSGRDEGLVATVADGMLCTYAVKTRFHTQGRKTVISLDATKKVGPDYALKRITLDKLAPAIHGALDPHGPHGDCARAGIHGFWTPGPPRNVRIDGIAGQSQSAGVMSQDKDTSPQYLPLHRHRQVELLVYNESVHDTKTIEALGSTSGSDPWVFGLPLPLATRVNCHQLGQDGVAFTDGAADHDVEGIVGAMEDDFSIDREEMEFGVGGHDQGGAQDTDGDLLHL